MKKLELRRHSFSARDEHSEKKDELSQEGLQFAFEIGRSLKENYTHFYTSPANRAIQTLTCFLEVMGKKFEKSMIHEKGLYPSCFLEDSPEKLAEGLKEILKKLPNGGYALAVSHSPLIEMGIYGLTEVEIEDLKECEGVVIILDDDGNISIEEKRIKTG